MRPSRVLSALAGTAALGSVALTAACGGGSSAATPGPAVPAQAPRASITPTTPTGLPWARPDNTRDAVVAAGLTALTAEGSVSHYHAHLDVIVDGRPQPVPAGLGIVLVNKDGSQPASSRLEQLDAASTTVTYSPLHTHDVSGVIHIESPTKTDYTLGELFTEWQVPLAPGQVGQYTSGVAVYVDGAPYAGDPRALAFAPHQEIAVVVGQTPPTIPSSYTFAAGQ